MSVLRWPLNPVEGEVHFRQKRIAVGFHPATFDAIAARAAIEGVAVADRIRHLVELGLVMEEEHDKAHAQGGREP